MPCLALSFHFEFCSPHLRPTLAMLHTEVKEMVRQLG